MHFTVGAARGESLDRVDQIEKGRLSDLLTFKLQGCPNADIIIFHEYSYGFKAVLMSMQTVLHLFR